VSERVETLYEEACSAVTGAEDPKHGLTSQAKFNVQVPWALLAIAAAIHELAEAMETRNKRDPFEDLS
jgi:hypothetical protein